MNLYLLTQTKNNGYDTYDSMVIAANSEEDAKHLRFVRTHLYSKHVFDVRSKPVWRDYYQTDFNYDDWSLNPTITLLAIDALVEEGIVCASFNAG